MDDQVKFAIAAYATSFIAVIILGIIFKLTGRDRMSETVFESEWIGSLCGENGLYCYWPLTHFILYLVLGIGCPKIFPYLFLVGIMWELFELIIGKVVLKIKGPRNPDKKTQYGHNWISGKYSDLMFNGLGLLLGVIIRKVYDSCRAKERDDPEKQTV